MKEVDRHSVLQGGAATAVGALALRGVAAETATPSVAMEPCAYADVAPGSGDLGDSLSTTHAGFEAPCGTNGHFKVARYPIQATGQSCWGDAMERLRYNAVLGALPLCTDGGAFYHACYDDFGTQYYHQSHCPCCSGTIGRWTADDARNACFRDSCRLFVNLYIAREWRDGDRIEITFDRPLRTQTIDAEHRDRVAVVQGPLALFATGDRFVPLRPEQRAAIRQGAPGSVDWNVTTDAGARTFKPGFAIDRAETTRLYQVVA